MNVPLELQAQLDAEGRLALPSDLLSQFGLGPGVQVRIDRRSSGLHLRQPVTHLGKVYVEPTNACNLDCRTCIRNVWDEPLGWMTRRDVRRASSKGCAISRPRPPSFSAALASRWRIRTLSRW